MKYSWALNEKWIPFLIRILYFGRNSGVHGLKYVFKKGVVFYTRIFWLSILLALTGCLYVLLKPVVLRANDVSFTPDTLYLDWTTTFPALTVCETYNSKMAQKKLAALYPNLTESLNFDYRRYITDLIYGRGSCSRSVCTSCGDTVSCDVPWRAIIRDVHLSCSELLSACNFNMKTFVCCKRFLLVDSEYGSCYSFNSLQNKNRKRNKLFFVNRTTGPGQLSFRLTSDAQISIHSTEELSTNILDTKFKFDIRIQMEQRVDILISVKETQNDPLVRFEDIGVRKCRYSEEIPLAHFYPVYSYGACRLAVNTEQSFKYCGCIHPARDVIYSGKYCNFTGLNCLVTREGKNEISLKLNYVRTAYKTKLGIATIPDSEDCLPSCEESEISVIHISRYSQRRHNNRSDGTLVNIRMNSLPTMRYQKKMLRTNLDLVVSVGGMVGLFFGASVLSAAEAFYLIIRNPRN